MYAVNEHEERLNELITSLNVEGVNQARVSLLIQELRDNYNDLTNTFTENTKTIENFTQTNEGLRSANMQLLSKLGTSFNDLPLRDKEELKQQKQGGQPPVQGQEEKSMSLDDIVGNFI